jgi:hypothetical protein
MSENFCEGMDNFVNEISLWQTATSNFFLFLLEHDITESQIRNRDVIGTLALS